MFGADPEVFAFDKKSKDVIPPVIFRRELGLKFTPNGRHPIFIQTNNFIVHEDGVAFEVGVPPSDTLDGVLANVKSAYQALGELLDKYGYGLSIVPAIKFDTSRWAGMPDYIRDCMIFGCDVDYDAFNFNRASDTIDAMSHPWRYGGGHIHYSGHPMFADDPISSIKVFAATVGNAAVAHSPVTHLERQRTFLYGKPGKYRVQHYPDGSTGVEYRTPSNTWTNSDDVFNAIKYYSSVALQILSGSKVEALIKDVSESTKKAIIEQDKTLARGILATVESYI